MTLLILLFSVAVAEWIVRRFEPASDNSAHAWARQYLTRKPDPGPVAGAAGSSTPPATSPYRCLAPIRFPD